MKKIKRRPVKIDTSNQMWLFADALAGEVRDEPAQVQCAVQFIDPNPRTIRINEVPLESHLKQCKQNDVFNMRALLEAVSFAEFEADYSPVGRRPYAPRAMIGLILFGIMRGQSSLRDLERLARTDLAVWWLTGGIAPDHSIIGRFIKRHDAYLTEKFFSELTAKVLVATGSSTKTVAGDGTVVEAAASRFGTVRREALELALKEARGKVAAAPDDQDGQAVVSRLEKASEQLKEREEARQARGREAEKTCIQPMEPDAVIQPQKDKKNFRASYKPQVLANAARVIVACDVHASSETKPVGALLDQAAALGKVETALFDAGYFNDEVIQATAERTIELLCPQGQSEGENWDKQSDKQFPKNRFVFDPASNTYRCPQGELLTQVGVNKGQQPHVKYGTTACGQCPLRAKCTTSKKRGRQIKRYPGDGAKDALRAKMTDPDVRKRYRSRQAMVEPVFSHLRGRHGLNRFRRSGLAAVRLEFALHAMAYNLSRVLALGRFDLLPTLLAALRLIAGFLTPFLPRPPKHMTNVLK